MSNWWNEGTKQTLLARSRAAAHSAYCPYSKFKVGAAAIFLNEDDHHLIVDGCNIENASYGLTICAERTTIFKGVSQNYRRLVAIAVSCPSWQKGMPISFSMLCGACRQVMAEFAIDLERMPVYIDNVGDPQLADLLPSPFKLRSQIMDRATAQQVVFAEAYGGRRERVYCCKCDRPVYIEKQRSFTKAAVLDCGHLAVYEEDTGTWDVI